MQLLDAIDSDFLGVGGGANDADMGENTRLRVKCEGVFLWRLVGRAMQS